MWRPGTTNPGERRFHPRDDDRRRRAIVISLVPAIGWWKTYSATWLRFDAIASLTAAAVVIPNVRTFALLNVLWRRIP